VEWEIVQKQGEKYAVIEVSNQITDVSNIFFRTYDNVEKPQRSLEALYKHFIGDKPPADIMKNLAKPAAQPIIPASVFRQVHLETKIGNLQKKLGEFFRYDSDALKEIATPEVDWHKLFEKRDGEARMRNDPSARRDRGRNSPNMSR